MRQEVSVSGPSQVGEAGIRKWTARHGEAASGPLFGASLVRPREELVVGFVTSHHRKLAGPRGTTNGDDHMARPIAAAFRSASAAILVWSVPSRLVHAGHGPRVHLGVWGGGGFLRRSQERSGIPQYLRNEMLTAETPKRRSGDGGGAAEEIGTVPGRPWMSVLESRLRREGRGDGTQEGKRMRE
ncbi:uncharacterized protein LOC125044074 [Penaeus chinensis]|uniref:uncharacterized protein LOC125044074 n=1 Tax=Penaeus chinensis TaxID=139456 RepID=UPI001FB801EA|nr:uncharacterized protein LOC125044074 [Penaeus chinensis]